ncbi:MAG: hypothetical protein ISS66_15835 [Desulfobacteraceae bacterium]|nr:hypothetical protein [Desulfobacteraceae bacterium]
MAHEHSDNYGSSTLHNPLPEESILIIGAGYFGRRAARLLRQVQLQRKPLFIVDREGESLAKITESSIERIQSDGIQFLVKNFQFLQPSNFIIPAIPVHLSAEYLKNYLHKDFRIKQTDVPGEIKRSLPHTWPGSEGSLLISYADFTCPDDCPEPEDYCTVTGERRETPLYELLGQLDLPGYRVYVIRSHQLMPGLGGYSVDDLMKLVDGVKQERKGRWLVGTACKCHGTLTALEIQPGSTPPAESHGFSRG